MVNLIEDDEGGRRLGAAPVEVGPGGDLGVGQRRAVIAAGHIAGGVAKAGVQLDADPCPGVGPLLLEVFRGGDDTDPPDRAAVQQLGGNPQRERRLADPGVATARKSRGIRSR